MADSTAASEETSERGGGLLSGLMARLRVPRYGETRKSDDATRERTSAQMPSVKIGLPHSTALYARPQDARPGRSIELLAAGTFMEFGTSSS